MKTLTSTFIILLTTACMAQKFSEKEVALGELKGTLTTPSKRTPKAILLISGSGPTDRDGNSAMGFTNNSLKMLSNRLVAEGYAVLRYDKRGIAASREAVVDQSALRFSELIEDAKNWAVLLSKEGYRKIIIAGHSQGSLVGMIAAQGNQAVKGFISLAGAADDAGTIVLQQLENQAPVLVPEAKAILDSMREGHTVNKVNPFLTSLFGPQIQGYLRSYIAYVPSDEIRKLSIPVLIINGTTDLQVPVLQAKKLKEAYPKADLVIIEEMNHVLKTVSSDPTANLETYRNPELPLSEGLLNPILTFVKTI